VTDEPDFEPSIDATDNGLAVKNGTFIVTGQVQTCAERVKAEEIFRGVNGRQCRKRTFADKDRSQLMQRLLDMPFHGPEIGKTPGLVELVRKPVADRRP
jgi:hypothetical protein